jgi:hypothetical protein
MREGFARFVRWSDAVLRWFQIRQGSAEILSDKVGTFGRCAQNDTEELGRSDYERWGEGQWTTQQFVEDKEEARETGRKDSEKRA